MKPGARTSPRAFSRSRAAAPGPIPTAVMRPPVTAMLPRRSDAPVPSTIRASSITRSCMNGVHSIISLAEPLRALRESFSVGEPAAEPDPPARVSRPERAISQPGG
jgi:hypothetical protein